MLCDSCCLSWIEIMSLHYHTIQYFVVSKQTNQTNKPTINCFLLFCLFGHTHSGFGEWEDPNRKTRCRILWRKPEQLASDVYDWAMANGFQNSVCTLYELHSGEDVNGMSFQGADEELLRRALRILESQGKCTIFKGETSDEDGIKFV
mmetsp:Transcript_27211/g.41771  ORF Transcript_27211/g.41771 Transcript_27211/m.41771 type:complete len:148 (-) Transcript_27211:76-519(-)